MERVVTVPMIGLTGKRNVGKTTFADILVSDYGFARAHAFESGKVAAFSYFRQCGADHDHARRMVWGDLKDVSSNYLPDGVAPRHFMEKFGEFMGQTMGTAWTLGLEVRRTLERFPGQPIVVESVVYETDWFLKQGGIVVRVVRPDHVGPVGISSDAAQASICADAVLINDGDISQLKDRIAALVQPMLGGR